jgi:tetratricopeptide (TPR) repeat protein
MKTVAILLCSFVLGSTLAHAELEVSPAQKAKAKELYERAKVHYRSGELEKAASEFKESYETYPQAETLFNLAQTHRLLKNYEKAIFYYKQYLSSGEISEQARKMTRERIADLENLVKQQRDAQAAPPNGPEPPSTNQPAPPPTTGSTTSPLPERTATGNGSARHADDRPWHSRPSSIAGFTLIGVGVALAAAGGGLFGYASSLNDDARRASTLAEQQRLHDDASAARIGGGVLIGVGVASAIGGSIAVGVAARTRTKMSAFAVPSRNGFFAGVGGVM